MALLDRRFSITFSRSKIDPIWWYWSLPAGRSPLSWQNTYINHIWVWRHESLEFPAHEETRQSEKRLAKKGTRSPPVLELLWQFAEQTKRQFVRPLLESCECGCACENARTFLPYPAATIRFSNKCSGFSRPSTSPKPTKVVTGPFLRSLRSQLSSSPNRTRVELRIMLVSSRLRLVRMSQNAPSVKRSIHPCLLYVCNNYSLLQLVCNNCCHIKFAFLKKKLKEPSITHLRSWVYFFRVLKGGIVSRDIFLRRRKLSFHSTRWHHAQYLVNSIEAFVGFNWVFPLAVLLSRV